MNKNLLKNPWILGGLHFILTVIIGSILHLINERFDIKSNGAVAMFFAALTTGQIYTLKIKELMSKKLRLKVSFIAVIIQSAIGILLGLFLDFEEIKWMDYLVALLIATVIVFFGVYFGLGTGGKVFLKFIERQEELRKKEYIK